MLAYAAYTWLPRGSGLSNEDATQDEPPARPIENTLELQIALARAGYSPGSIDGALGSQTRNALVAYQQANALSETGEFDALTQEVLKIREPVLYTIQLDEADFIQIDPPPLSWVERGTRQRMAYNSILEMVAERSRSDPDLIVQLNPLIDWNQLHVGQEIHVPYFPHRSVEANATHLKISLSQRSLQAINADGDICFHAPVSIARRVDKRPNGELRVVVRVAEPNYTFNPAILSATAAREGITEKFIIQPGPNNPVGSVWIGLNLPSYGIHGTPEPEKVGRTESSGCFRLANWNASILLGLVYDGMSIYVEP